MTRWPRDGLEVVAVLGTPGDVVFDRAAVVVRREGRLLVVARWEVDGPAGREIASEDLEAMLDQGEAGLVEPTAPRGSIWAWFVNGGFGPELERLVAAARPLRTDVMDGSRMLLVDESAVGWLRAQWATLASERSRGALERRGGAEALRWAELGWAIAPMVTPLHVALLVQASELAGDPSLGRDLRAVERRIRGEAFDAEVASWLRELPVSDVVAPPWRASARHALGRQLCAA